MSVEPGAETLDLLAEANGVSGAVLAFVVASLNDGDNGDDHDHEEDGKLRELHFAERES